MTDPNATGQARRDLLHPRRRLTPALTRFIAASGLANLADGIATVAWAWLASLLTRDALLIALVPVALRLPWFLFAVPAGLHTDRVDRRRLIMAMDGVRAAAFALAGLGVWLALPLPPAPAEGVGQPALFALVLVCALGVGAAEVYRDNAAQTMLPALVPHERLERANGRLWSVELVGNALLGPALGAFLLAVALPLPFVLNAAAFALALVLVAGVKGRFSPAARAARDWRAELAEGYAFLRDAPLLRTLALVTGAWNLLFSMAFIALVLHAQENLHMDAPTYGLVLAAGALGGILGGWLGEPIIARLGRARTARWATLFSAPAFLLMALAPGPVALGLVFMLFEFSGLVWNTVSVSYRQRTIPDALLGRVNSLYRLLAWGMMPVGLLLSGLVVRAGEAVTERSLALELPFWVASLGALLLAMAAWRALGRGFAAG